MHTAVLVDRLLQQGEKTLDALDRSGLRPVGAFWYFSTYREFWRLALQFELPDGFGSRPVYGFLGDLIAEHLTELGDLKLVQMTVQLAQSHLFSAVRGKYPLFKAGLVPGPQDCGFRLLARSVYLPARAADRPSSRYSISRAKRCRAIAPATRTPHPQSPARSTRLHTSPRSSAPSAAGFPKTYRTARCSAVAHLHRIAA